MNIPWWVGVAANGVFFPVFWVGTMLLVPEAKMWAVQLMALPLVYGMNLWFAYSVSRATHSHVLFAMVMLIEISISALTSLGMGRVLGQHVTMLQLVGVTLAVGGLILMQTARP